MAFRTWAPVAIFAVAAGCSAPEQMSRAPVLPGDSAPVRHPPPPTPTGEPDDDASLLTWKTSVLDRADSETLGLIRKDIEARLVRLQERDAELSYLPPGIALDERMRIARRIAFEKQRLKLVDERE